MISASAITPISAFPFLMSGAHQSASITAVIETGLTPLINTGIAGRKAGTGQIAAGIVRARFACFARALEAFFE